MDCIELEEGEGCGEEGKGKLNKQEEREEEGMEVESRQIELAEGMINQKKNDKHGKVEKEK